MKQTFNPRFSLWFINTSEIPSNPFDLIEVGLRCSFVKVLMEEDITIQS
jgi:hypothetical protein